MKYTALLAETAITFLDCWLCTKILIDSGADQTYLSYIFLKFNDWTPPDELQPPSHFIDRQFMSCYAQMKFEVNITDSESTTCVFTLLFEVINMVGYDVLIECDWLHAVNSEVDWLMASWWYCCGSLVAHVKVESPRHFSKISCGLNVFFMQVEPILRTVKTMGKFIISDFYKKYFKQKKKEKLKRKKEKHVWIKVNWFF
jgi:hypothetical protein